MTVRVMCDYDGCNTTVIADSRTGDWLLDQGDGFDYCPDHATKVIHVRIDREHSKPCWVGPYLTEADAEHALQNALIIDGLCEEDCTDAYVEIGPYDTDTDDVYLIDLNNPQHTGRE